MFVARHESRIDALERRAAAHPIWASSILLAVAWLALLWPALLNGQPLLFHDTTAYIRGAAFPAEKFIGLKTVWSQSVADAAPSAPNAPASIATAATSLDDKTVIAGRSVYYGSLLFWGFVVGGMWLPVLVQAAIVAAAVFGALRHLIPRPATSTVAALAVLGVATPLSWFSGYMMPDVFAGLGVLSASLLITHADRMTWPERGIWSALLAFSLAAHTSHLVTAIVILGLAVAGRLTGRPDWRLAGLALAIGVAGLADMAFSLAVTRATGAAPVRPPMLSARVMHSDTGRAYLQGACPSAGYAVCAYVHRPAMTANDFLWSTDPAIGVFSLADASTRRALSDEQKRVFVGALLAAPIATTRELLTRWGMLLAITDIPEFNHTAADRAYFAAKLPGAIHTTFATTPSARGTLPTAPFQRLFLLTTFGGAILSLLLVRSETRRVADLALMLLAGVVINAAICSALSGVEPRYETRMIWLLPLLAMALSWRRAARVVEGRALARLPARTS